ncbi:DUF883 family protein [Polaromonas sp.]|uniref:DUF883 family protein n=1 Tax=Polaromonas sp. TaxID=1869339 RepID=UPI003BAB2C9F
MEKIVHPTVSGDESAANAIQRRVDATGAALHNTIDKVAEPARHAVERVAGGAHEAVDKLANTANRFSGQTHRLTEAPARALETSRSWVQERPLEAVGVALALGFILGRLSAR